MSTPVTSDAPYLTLEEFCDLVHAPRRTVYQWTHLKQVPHLRIGRRLLFDRAEITAWLDTRRVSAIG